METGLEINQIVLCKQLFGESERFLAKGGSLGFGLAVSTAQDSVELFLRAVIKQLAIPGKRIPDEFAKCMDYIDEAESDPEKMVPFRGKLNDLNRARVGFKHYGLAPEKTDAYRLVGYVEQFLTVATERFFSRSFSEISLADVISYDAVRLRIKGAEEALRREDFQEVCGLCAEAFEISASRILWSVKYRGGAQMLIGVPSEVEDAIGQEASNALKRYIEKLTASSNRVSLMLALSLDVNELHLFEGMVPGIVQTRDGTLKRNLWLGVGPFKLEDFSFALDFATRFAVAVDARLPMLPKAARALEPNL